MRCWLYGGLLGLPLALAAVAAPGPVRDLAYGEALFDFYRGDYFTAIVRIEAEASRRRLVHQAEDADLLRGSLLLSYGLPGDAEAVFRRLLDERVAPTLRDRAWLLLARLAQSRGDLELALAALGRVSDGADPEQRAEVGLRRGLLAMARGRPAEAVTALESGGAPPGWRAYLDFNRAVALAAADRPAEALALLERLGGAAAAAGDAEAWAIRDRANLAAGYRLLDAGATARARETFSRVRLDGLAAEAALLGAGWAALGAGDPAGAVVPWANLAARPGAAAAVLEAGLALPFAEARRGALGSAEARYQEAIERFERRAAALRSARSALAGGRLIGLVDGHPGTRYDDIEPALEAMLEASEFDYLGPLLASAEFQRALAEYLELGRLTDRLARRRADLEAFDTMLDARRQRYALVLPRIARRLAQLAPSDLRARRDALAEHIGSAAAAPDPWVHARAAELAWREQLRELGRGLQQLPPSPAQAAAAAKLRLLQGVLEWEVDAALPQRRWEARKTLRSIDEQLGELDRLRARLGGAEGHAALRLGGLSERLAAQRARLERLAPRLAAARAGQARELTRLAGVALERALAQLQTYTAQARFGLAELYDRAASGGADRP